MKRRHIGPKQTSITLKVDDGRIRLKGSYLPGFYAALKAQFPSWAYNGETFTWSVNAEDRDAVEGLACRHFDRVTVVNGEITRQLKPYPW
jgi:hypothetical protein